MAAVNEQTSMWANQSLADRAMDLRYKWAKKEKYAFRLQAPPCEHEWLIGTVRHVTVTGGVVQINGGKGIGLVEVPIDLILEVRELEDGDL